MLNGQTSSTRKIVRRQDEIDLRPILRRWLHSWYWIGLSVLLFGFLGWTYLHYATEIYKVEGSLLIRSDDRSGFTQEAILFSELGFGKKNNLENELQILKSFPVLAEVIDSLQLTTTYFHEETIKSTELYKETPILATIQTEDTRFYKKLPSPTSINIIPISDERFGLLVNEEDTLYTDYATPISLGDTVITITRVAELRHPIKVVFHNKASLVQKYLKTLKISNIEDSDVLTLSLEDAVPQKAIDFIQNFGLTQVPKIFGNNCIYSNKYQRIISEFLLDGHFFCNANNVPSSPGVLFKFL